MRPDHMGVIARAAAGLAEADGARAGCAAIIDDIAAALEARIAFIAVGRSDSSVADVLAASGLGAAEFRRLEARLTKSALWHVFRLGRSVAVDDTSKDPGLGHLAYASAARSILAAPIMLRGTVRGFVAVGYDRPPRASEDEILAFLDVIAALAAQALRTATRLTDESRKLAEENLHLKQELRARYDLARIVGNSSQMRQVHEQVAQIARTNSTILLRGETGTGKDLIANAVHYNSLRAKRPLVKVNAAGTSGAMIGAELFGAEKGAADGTASRRKGAVERADGGTLVIEEIGDLSGEIQDRVLELLDRQTFTRNGGTEKLPANIRLIATTARDLERAAADGSFSAELFNALEAFTIFLPPLRERRADILLLADHFLDKYSRDAGKPILRISTPAIDMLTAYHFPGNVRELENVMERAVVDCDSNVIHGRHLPPTLQTAEVSDTVTRLTLADAVEAFEADLIQDALKSSRGNIARAASMLDSTERILGYKIRKYGIEARRFKQWKRSSN